MKIIPHYPPAKFARYDVLCTSTEPTNASEIVWDSTFRFRLVSAGIEERLVPVCYMYPSSFRRSAVASSMVTPTRTSAA